MITLSIEVRKVNETNLYCVVCSGAVIASYYNKLTRNDGLIAAQRYILKRVNAQPTIFVWSK